MFCTTLSYICMRILGKGPDGGRDNACARARKWIRDRGGATSIPSWGKTWLSVWPFKQKLTFITYNVILCDGLNSIFHVDFWLVRLVGNKPNAPRVLALPFISSGASRFML